MINMKYYCSIVNFLPQTLNAAMERKKTNLMPVVYLNKNNITRFYKNNTLILYRGYMRVLYYFGVAVYIDLFTV